MDVRSKDFVPDIIIDRAVELWCRALRRPVFDNGDNSLNGLFTAGLGGMLQDQAIAKVDDYDAAIERFREILSAKLKFLRDHNGEPDGTEGKYGPNCYYFRRTLGTDYHPEPILADAATEAGVPHRAFSVKSTVHFFGDNYVSASFGYGAPDQYHYPLSDGSWLICQLTGNDMPTIIKAVEAGLLPEFTVEPPVTKGA